MNSVSPAQKNLVSCASFLDYGSYPQTRIVPLFSIPATTSPVTLTQNPCGTVSLVLCSTYLLTSDAQQQTVG